MKRKNILFLVSAVILLGVIIVYSNSQDAKKNGNDSEKGSTAEELKNSADSKKDNTEIVSSPEIGEIENKTIYYYGAECPHCEDVMAFLDENDIDSKVDFAKKEVWHNKNNGEELRMAALKCGLNPANIGVPFVFDKGKCYMGGPDVTSFFSKEAGLE